MTKARTLADNFAADINGITASAPLTGGGTSGTVTVGIQDGTTSQKGAVQLEDSTASTSTTKASTPNSVKSAYDLANGAIAKSTIDAKGDLLVGTANDTVSRLAVASTAGYVLTVDSAEATGLKWATVSAGGQTLITTSNFPTSGSATHTISNIPTTYKHLLILVKHVRAGDGSDGVANFNMRFNSDTGANYGQARAGSFAGGEYGSTSLSFHARLFNSTDTFRQDFGIIEIPRYTDTDTRFIHSVAYGIDQNTTPQSAFYASVYKGSAAITSITFTAGANFAGNGVAYVYGIS